MRVAIAGSHGMIGTALVDRLTELGHTPVRLSRGDEADPADIRWDPAAGRLDPAALERVDAVVNLAGAGIGDHRWTAAYKRTVLDSRTRSTNLLSEAIAALTDGPRVLLSGSAIGIYGDRGDERLDESSSLGPGFLASVAQAWEASTATAEAAGARVVHLRTGIVLARHGGALKRMRPLFSFGLGGRFGDGAQWMSWISLPDVISALVHLLDSDRAGAVNLTAPNPVTNRDFARTLGQVLRRPSFLPVPKFGPRLVLGGELAETLLFSSQRVIPTALLADGFAHAHPQLEPALRAVLHG